MRIGMTVGQIIDVIGGTTSLDHSFFVENIAAFSHAQEKDIAVVLNRGENSVFDDISLKEVEKSNAGLFLAAEPLAIGKQYILVENPLQAYQKLVKTYEIMQQEKDAPAFHKQATIKGGVVWGEGVTVDAGAVVSERSVLGDATSIGANAFIGKDCVIGKSVTIHPSVVILDRTVIGDHTILHSGVVVGSDGFGYQVTKTGMHKIPQIGNVNIGSHVEIGANTAIDRAAFGSTVIGNGVKIDNNVHIAHGVKIGPHTAIIAQTAIAGGVLIGAGCQIGGQVGIKDHVKIGNDVKIVSKSAVIRDVPDGAVVAGSPSMPFSHYKRALVAFAKLPEFMKKARQIEKKLTTKKSLWQRFFG